MSTASVLVDEKVLLNGLLSHIHNLQPNINGCMDELEELLEDVQYLPNNNFGNDDSDAYRKVFKELLKCNKSMQHMSTALTHTRTYITSTANEEVGQENVDDNVNLENFGFQVKFDEEFSKATSGEGRDEIEKEHTFRTDQRFQKFDKTVEKVVKANTRTEFVETAGNCALDEDIDDGLTLTEAIVSTIDPISQTQIQDPVRNKICKHAYDRKTIVQYINQQTSRKEQAKCPMTGCTNKRPLSMALLENYPQLLNQ